MSDERNETYGEPADERLAARVKEVLGAAVATAPPAPSVADIEARTAVRREGSGAGPAPAVTSSDSAADGLEPSDRAEGDVGLADYVTTAAMDDGARPGSRWPRLVLAAAVLVAVVSAAVAMVGRDDTQTVGPASGSESDGAVVGVLPTAPPEGMVLIWIGHHADGAGSGTTLRYNPTEGGEPLMITSTVFDQNPVPASGASTTTVVETGDVDDPGVSDESLNVLMGDREVLLSNEGRTVRFVGPVGMAVEVTGEPDDVAAVVPTLETVDAARWRSFEGLVSADIEALPTVASYQVETGGPEGLDFDGVDTIRLSVHASNGAGSGIESGVVAGTCLTVDETTTCRPGQPVGDTIPPDLRSTYDVLIDGDWWQFGWMTGQLTSYTLEPDHGGDVEAHWYFEGAGQGHEMTWFVARMADTATTVTAELGGSGGFQQLRPAS